MTVKEIIAEWLKEYGYDGLCFLCYSCGCGVDDLMPCYSLSSDCKPAYRWKCTPGQSKDCDLETAMDGFNCKCYRSEKQEG
jgi:hypothetical protein